MSFNYFKDFFALFFPELCITCNENLLANEVILCTKCRHELPETGFDPNGEHAVAKIFWGRVNLVSTTSLLFFDHGSKYREAIYHLKYKGRKDVGLFFGRMLGAHLNHKLLTPFDAIIPLPLHPAKFRKRGYNQSEIIAQGIAEICNKPVVTNILFRKSHTLSQTRKGRFARWQNMEGNFYCTIDNNSSPRHFLLVDDVVTTGATLEAAAAALLSFKNCSVSIATLAYSTL